MSTAQIPANIRTMPGGAGFEVLGALMGAVFTFGLFMGVSHFESGEAPPEPVNIAELRAMSIPMEAPPPRPTESPVAAASSSPLAGLDVSPSESDVKIAVVPPDLEPFVPAPKSAPAATIQVSELYTQFKPGMDLSADFAHIFQQSEVDKIPTVLSRPIPYVPSWIRGGAESLRVYMVFVINTDGTVGSVRILESSGNPQFDAIIERDAKEAWLFTPAIKKGKRVRCMVSFPTRVKWTGGSSPFEP